MPAYAWIIISIIVAILFIVIASMIYAYATRPPPNITRNTSNTSGYVPPPNTSGYVPPPSTSAGITPPAPVGTTGSYMPEASTQSVGDIRATGTVDKAYPVIDAVRALVPGIQTTADNVVNTSKINRTNATQFPTITEVKAAYVLAADDKIKAGDAAGAQAFQTEGNRAETIAKYAERIRMILVGKYPCGANETERNMLGGCSVLETSAVRPNGSCPTGYTLYTSGAADPIAPGIKRCVTTMSGKSAKHLQKGPSFKDPKPYSILSPSLSDIWMTYL